MRGYLSTFVTLFLSIFRAAALVSQRPFYLPPRSSTTLMAGKVEIATTTYSTEDLDFILSEYTSTQLLKRTQLFGGYSGSNYRVYLDDGSVFILKITNGYLAEHVKLMCQTNNHLGEAGYYKDCCLPIPRR